MLSLIGASILLLTFWNSQANYSIEPSTGEYREWVNMTDELLAKWYPPLDVCMLKNKATTFDECLKLRKQKLDLYCETTSQCMYAPPSLYQRPYGYDTHLSPSENHKVVEMIIHLNKTGRVLFFIGDSLARNTVNALRCALKQRNSLIAFDPPFPKEQFGHSSTVIYIPTKLPGSDTTVIIESEVHFYAVWGPLIADLQQVVVKAVNSVIEANRSVVLVANIGLHERSGEKHEIHLINLFKWVQSKDFGDMPGKFNSFYYRETSVQHFPNSPGGYYSVWIGENKKGLRQGNNRTCVQFDQFAPENVKGNWRSEAEKNAFEYSRLRLISGKSKTPIHHLHFYNLTMHLHDIHPSAPTSKERYYFDCTHYCGYVPLLWQALFYQMYNIILPPTS